MVRAAGATRGPRADLVAAGQRARATTASTRPTRAELIASSHTVDEIARFIEADSLGYLSAEGLLQAVGEREGCALLRRLLHRRLPGPARDPARRQLRLIEV